MPTYEIRNQKTGEVKEIFCSYDEKVKLFKDNPDWKDTWNHAPGVDFQGKSAIARTDSGWKEMLSRIGEAHPASDINKEHNRRSTKEIKIDKILKDRGLRK